MITGENGYPVDDLEIDVELRDKMVSHIQNRIMHNLEAIQNSYKFQAMRRFVLGCTPTQLKSLGRSFI